LKKHFYFNIWSHDMIFHPTFAAQVNEMTKCLYSSITRQFLISFTILTIQFSSDWGMKIGFLIDILIQLSTFDYCVIVHLDKSVMVCNNIFHLFVFKEWNEYIILFRCIIKLGIPDILYRTAPWQPSRLSPLQNGYWTDRKHTCSGTAFFIYIYCKGAVTQCDFLSNFLIVLHLRHRLM
jgi:hypothetical protein